MAGNPLDPECRAMVTVGGREGAARVKKVVIVLPSQRKLVLDPETFPDTYTNEAALRKDVMDTLGEIRSYDWSKDLDSDGAET